MSVAGRLAAGAAVLSLAIGWDGSDRQLYRIEGRLVEANVAEGSPVPEGWVHISSLRLGAYTDTLGRFVLSARARPGCYRLRTAYIGHKSAWHDFELGTRNRVQLGDIPLESTAIMDRPTRTGTCVPADSNVNIWAAGYGSADVTVIIPDSVVLDSLWILNDWCAVEVPRERAIAAPKPGAHYRIPLDISAQRVVSLENEPVERVACRIAAYTRKKLAGYTDVEVKVARRMRDVVPVPVRIELRSAGQPGYEPPIHLPQFDTVIEHVPGSPDPYGPAPSLAALRAAFDSADLPRRADLPGEWWLIQTVTRERGRPDSVVYDPAGYRRYMGDERPLEWRLVFGMDSAGALTLTSYHPWEPGELQDEVRFAASRELWFQTEFGGDSRISYRCKARRRGRLICLMERGEEWEGLEFLKVRDSAHSYRPPRPPL